MKIIERTKYLDKLKASIGIKEIKIITGVRRSGKSELLRSFIKYIKKSDKKANIIYVDFYDLKNEYLKDYKELNKYIESKYKIGKNNFIFIDEVQLCKNFELTINSINNSKKYDIYITGSNAFLLSSDLSTLFTGRYIELPIFPFSFNEFCKYFSKEKDINKLFDKYVKIGGFAGSYEFSDDSLRNSYIKDIYNTIVKRDLIDKYNISDEITLEHLSDFMLDNISNITSSNNISNILKSNKISTNHITVKKYMKYLCNAFIFYNAKRYDIKGKKYLDTLDKYYLCDVSFRFVKLGSRNIDYGRIYENIVYIELLRRGYEVYIGKLYNKEIDFVTIKNDEKVYIQVCDNISYEQTLTREVEPLLSIKTGDKKIIIANTKHDTYSYEGIPIYDISKWLLDT